MKYIYIIKFSKVLFLKITLAPLATLFILKSSSFQPCDTAAGAVHPCLPQDLLLSCSSGCVVALCDKFQWPHFASPAA